MFFTRGKSDTIQPIRVSMKIYFPSSEKKTQLHTYDMHALIHTYTESQTHTLRHTDIHTVAQTQKKEEEPAAAAQERMKEMQ